MRTYPLKFLSKHWCWGFLCGRFKTQKAVAAKKQSRPKSLNPTVCCRTKCAVNYGYSCSSSSHALPGNVPGCSSSKSSNECSLERWG